MFLEMRREAVAKGTGRFKQHEKLRRYEKLGTSSRFTWYALPQDCDTIFFPGCALTGALAETTLQTFEHLRETVPGIGIVLDCCTKPSHDLGDDAYFQAMFGEMKAYLAEHGIRNILVACPNCHKVFDEYAQEFTTRSIYEHLDGRRLPKASENAARLTLHDPCAARFLQNVQASVRKLANEAGLPIEEPLHSGATSLCCGAGGAVAGVAPELAQSWTHKRLAEANGNRIASYCAGCTSTLGKHGAAVHLLDLLFDPDKSSAGKTAPARAPQTYLNRLRVKKRLQRDFAAAVTRERTCSAGRRNPAGLGKRLAGWLLGGTGLATGILFLWHPGQLLVATLILTGLSLLLMLSLMLQCLKRDQITWQKHHQPESAATSLSNGQALDSWGAHHSQEHS
jgi:hypothetical protein